MSGGEYVGVSTWGLFIGMSDCRKETEEMKVMVNWANFLLAIRYCNLVRGVRTWGFIYRYE